MNGAELVLRTLVNSGVDICFTNPGTSEMHFVAAFDQVEGIRGVLGLHENVVTGAADGYARISGRPASTLLHLGPGLGNGFANLHNARRAHTPLVNIVGDHATYHKQFDAPLETDIEAIAGACSRWVGRSKSVDDVAQLAAEAVAQANAGRGGVATLILPADVAWSAVHSAPATAAVSALGFPDVDRVEAAQAAMTSGERTVLLIGGRALRGRGLRAAQRSARATGAVLIAETFPAHMERGGALPAVDRLAYLAEFAAMQIGDAAHIILVDVPSPVSFFAYPSKPSDLVPENANVIHLVDENQDAVAALEALADALDAPAFRPEDQPGARPDRPTGEVTLESVAAAIGATLPEGAIVADESNTSGLFVPGATQHSPEHDVMCITGGAIGIGLPLALGASLAAPDRPTVCLASDGSSLYTLPALWTMAREGCNITTVLYNNRSYAVLNMELKRVGADRTERAAEMLDLSRPDQDFVALAQGLGVPALRVERAEDLTDALEQSYREPGPLLIECVVEPLEL
ncbi:MAG: acetolactate synthase large subunit [Acidimicrobiia bacterium]